MRSQKSEKCTSSSTIKNELLLSGISAPGFQLPVHRTAVYCTHTHPAVNSMTSIYDFDFYDFDLWLQSSVSLAPFFLIKTNRVP
jgi:hypothetical protein